MVDTLRELGGVHVGLLAAAWFACLYLAAVGAVVSERAGVSALALDATLVVGALAGSWAGLRHGPGAGLATGAGAGAAAGALLAVLVVLFRVNQLLAAVGVALLGYAAAMYAGTLVLGPATAGLARLHRIPLRATHVRVLAHSAVTPLLAAALGAGLLAWVVLRGTRTGLRVRAVGESGPAAAALGVRARTMAVSAAVVGGLLAGLGGAGIAIEVVGRTGSAPVIGRGYLVLAAVLVARRSLAGALLPCALLAWLEAVAAGHLASGPWAALVAVLPWVVALVLLALAAAPARAPGEIRAAYDAGTG